MRNPLISRKTTAGPAKEPPPAKIPIIAVAISTLTVMAVCTLLQPCWETNDDVAMSMIAHGYGAVAFGSPNIVFSNILWGYFVWFMPSLVGIPGYSVATLLSLIVAGGANLYALLRMEADLVCTVSYVVMFLLSFTFSPQFTVNSGLLTVAAVSLLLAYSRSRELHMLILALVLAFGGFLIRTAEFLFVLGVALPLLPFRFLRTDRNAILAVTIFAVATALALYADMLVYRGTEWQAFNALNSIRVSFTDYGVGNLLKARPDILARYGYSATDIDLVTGFFFLDPRLADPSSLKSMVADLGSHTNFGSLANVTAALKALFKPALLPFSGAAFLLALLFRNSRHLLAVLLFIAGIVGMGILGRPGVVRIYYAPLVLLTIVPIIGLSRIAPERMVARITLGLALLGNVYWVTSKSRTMERQMKQIKQSIPYLQKTPIIAWGGAFPYNLVYPVLSEPPQIRIRSLGSFSLAPYSRLVTEEAASATTLAQIKSGAVVHFSATPDAMKAFAIYCQERLAGSPVILKDESQPESLKLFEVQCKPRH
ncbi:MAG: hypothetical protein AB7S74_03600 [Hyphomicrobium sp.]